MYVSELTCTQERKREKMRVADMTDPILLLEFTRRAAEVRLEVCYECPAGSALALYCGHKSHQSIRGVAGVYLSLCARNRWWIAADRRNPVYGLAPSVG